MISLVVVLLTFPPLESWCRDDEAMILRFLDSIFLSTVRVELNKREQRREKRKTSRSI